MIGLDWQQEDLCELSLFTLNPKILPTEVLFRAADIHYTLLKDGSPPTASVNALRTIDDMRRCDGGKPSTATQEGTPDELETQTSETVERLLLLDVHDDD
ncbi:hypothetical protein AURDEDRAFT_171277 [Auricularia subglabra TFB-10046 SS5]|nr:hypothetical protein AURDEDRAFT_171277 [Auricularia subglabra TFB-10046 SS5]